VTEIATPPQPSWIQPMLAPPERLELGITVHLSGPAGELGVTVEIREGSRGTLCGLVATSWPLTDGGMLQAIEFISTHARTAWYALAPF